MLSTLHGRLDVPSLLPIYRASPACRWFQSVTHSVDRCAAPTGRQRSTTASTWTNSPSTPAPASYLAFIGRISPDKGLDVAIRVARRAGWPLLVAARPPLPLDGNPEVQRDRDYFEHVIKPLLCEPGVELIGQVGGSRKNEFLGNAAALLFPIRWPEPFGLVMPESLACGTPVLALREGSVPEVLQDGVTGFVRHFENELVQAVKRIPELDRRRAGSEAERRFSPAAMADAYEDVYAALLQSLWSPEVALSA